MLGDGDGEVDESDNANGQNDTLELLIVRTETERLNCTLFFFRESRGFLKEGKDKCSITTRGCDRIAKCFKASNRLALTFMIN
jgi:hypothetical protein